MRSIRGRIIYFAALKKKKKEVGRGDEGEDWKQ